MLLSRFWSLLLALLTAVAISVGWVAVDAGNRTLDQHASDEVERDRRELSSILRLEARQRMDALAVPAANNALAAELAKSTEGASSCATSTDRAAYSRALEAVQSSMGEMRGDLVFALDGAGNICAQVGSTVAPPGAGLGRFPLVARALAGFVRDDVWVYNGLVYRMAARPVIGPSGVVGALVHGMLLNDDFAARLAPRIGTNVGAFFYYRKRIVGAVLPSSTTAPSRTDIETFLASKDAVDGGLAVVRERGIVAIDSVVGSAKHAGVGFGVTRERPVHHSFVSFLEGLDSKQLESVPVPALVGGALLAFVIAMLLYFVERDLPLRRFRKAVRELGTNEASARIPLASQSGVYRGLAESVNQALDRIPASAPKPQRAASLDDLLGPSTTAAPPAAFFGFADGKKAEAAAPPVAPAPLRSGPPPAPRPAVGIPRSSADVAPRDSSSDARRFESDAPTQIAPSGSRDVLDEQSDAIMERLSQPPAPRAAPSSSVQLPVAEEAHFREVYDNYIATKIKCGEPTTGLSYEKFAQTLKKNREQIVAKHGSADVRFTVYVKDGKATLKASPIRHT